MVFNGVKISLLQFPILLGNREENLDCFLTKLQDDEHGSPHIIVLPEMWASGFDYTNLAEHAAHTDAVCNAIAERVGENTLVISSLPEAEDGKIFNTIFAVSKNGVAAKYRKNFLFAPTKEDQFFAYGNTPTAVFDFGGIRVGLHTCYEIRFPELFRMSAYQGAELFLVPAVWPNEKKEHWLTLLRARAIENQCYIAGCNASYVTTRKSAITCGNSAVFDPWGESIGRAEQGEQVVTCTATKEAVTEIREKIPSFADAAKAFTITL